MCCKKHRPAPLGVVLGAGLLLGLLASGRAQPTGAAPVAASAGATATTTNAPAPPDTTAARFMTTCAGCHSLAGVKLTGPELSHVGVWPDDQLKTAIKRMQEKVGPLKDEEVEALGALLRDAKVRERLKGEEARIQAQFMAKMEPPNAALGRDLFYGREPLRNGGLACAACHAGDGGGGNLWPLAGVHTKMGEMPLVSAIEKASFRIMEPHYRRHPVTKQEAMHLAKYLSTLEAGTVRPSTAGFVPLGAGGALAAFAGLAVYYRQQARGRATRLERRRK